MKDQNVKQCRFINFFQPFLIIFTRGAINSDCNCIRVNYILYMISIGPV